MVAVVAGVGLILTRQQGRYWPFTDTPPRAVLESDRNVIALRKELISVALLGWYWRGVRLVGYWQLQSSGGCLLLSVNRTKSVFYTVGLLSR